MAELTVQAIDAAIAELLVYKRTTIEGRTFEYQDLEQLRALRGEVAARAAAAAGTLFKPVNFVPR